MIVGVNHVQVNVPKAELDSARAFYVDFLGLKQVHRPDVFKSDGIWLDAGGFEVHIGLEDSVERTTRAHLAYEVDDVEHWREKVAEAGYKISEQPVIPGYDRFHFRDPFGNNIEIIGRVK